MVPAGELQAVRLGQRFEVRHLGGRIEPAQPDGEVATRPLETGPRVGGQQVAADGEAFVVATGQPDALDERGACGQQPDHLAVALDERPRGLEVDRHRRRPAELDQAADEVGPRPGERRARLLEHAVRILQRRIPIAGEQLQPATRAELPHATDRQVALDGQRDADGEQVGGLARAGGARRRGT